MTKAPHPCIVPGCSGEGINKLVIRCRVCVQAFHLSRGFLAEHLAGLSRDASGNVKFKVDRMDGRMTLRL